MSSISAERELDSLLQKTLDADFGEIPDDVLTRIVELEAIVALKRESQGLSGSYSSDYLDRKTLGVRPSSKPNSRFLQMTLVNALSSNSNRDRQTEDKIVRLKEMISQRYKSINSRGNRRDRSRSPSPRGGKRDRDESSDSLDSRPEKRPRDDRYDHQRSFLLIKNDLNEEKTSEKLLEDEKKAMKRIQKIQVRGRGGVGSKSDSLFPLPASNISVSSDSSSSESSLESREARKKRKREKRAKKKAEKAKRKLEKKLLQKELEFSK